MALSWSDVEQLQLDDYDQNRLEKVRLLNFLPIIETQVQVGISWVTHHQASINRHLPRQAQLNIKLVWSLIDFYRRNEM